MTNQQISEIYSLVQDCISINDVVASEDFTKFRGISDSEIEVLRNEAEKGDIKTMFVYAFLVLVFNITKKAESAQKNLLSAANTGDVLSSYLLGVAYEKGFIGLDIDYRKSFGYYLYAAEKSYMPAEFNLAWMYSNIVFYQDYEKTIYWYEKAKQQGHPDAQVKLDVLRENGELLMTCHLGNKEDFFIREGIQCLHSQQYQKAFLLFFNAACLGSETGIHNICSMMGQDIVPQEDLEDALKIIRIYADDENSDALSFLAACYSLGKYVAMDEKKAWELCERAAENGDLKCLNDMLSYCLNTLHDYEKANKWNQKGYEIGDARCTYNLALAYCKGLGKEKNITKGIELLKMAKERGAAGLGLPVDNAIRDFSPRPANGSGGCMVIVFLFVAILSGISFLM